MLCLLEFPNYYESAQIANGKNAMANKVNIYIWIKSYYRYYQENSTYIYVTDNKDIVQISSDNNLR